MMTILSHIGAPVLGAMRGMARVSAVVVGVAWLAASPRNWPRTVRELLGRQIIFTALDAFWLIMLIAVFTGASVVTQAQLWLGKFGQSEMLGPLLVAVIAREAGPLLVSFVLIGRSGTAIATELASMTVHGEVKVLEAQGIEPMIYLVMPRIMGMMVSVFVMGVLFVAVALLSGHGFGVLMGATTIDSAAFWESILGAMLPADFAGFAAKTLLAGGVAGAICCIEGLRVRGRVTEIPQAAIHGVVRSIATVLVLVVVISVFMYL